MRAIFVSDDGRQFASRADCEEHERRMGTKISVPLPLIEEAIRQCTPYMVSAKERKLLRLQLEMWRDAPLTTPTPDPSGEVQG